MKNQPTVPTGMDVIVPAPTIPQKPGSLRPGPDSPSSSVRRLFVSFPVPEAIQNTLAGVPALLRESAPARSLAWTNPTALHVTLKFLGNIDIALIPPLEERLRTSLASFGSFTVQCHALDWLPAPEHPRVLYAHIRAQPGKLEALQARVREASTGMGEPEHHRPLLGHVTLARTRRNTRLPGGIPTQIATRFRELVFGTWRVNECQLMASELHPGGAQHAMLARFPLE